MKGNEVEARHAAVLASVRDGYLAAVRRWGRDALIFLSGLFLAGAFLVVPYARHSKELGRLETRESEVHADLETLGTLLAGLEEIEGRERTHMEDLSRDGDELAKQLTTRLRRLGASIRALRAGIELADDFPGANMAEQFQPSEGAIILDPKDVLKGEYRMSQDEIDLLSRDLNPERDADDYELAKALVWRLVESSMQEMYAALDDRASLALDGLRAEVDRSLSDLSGAADALGLKLPTTAILIPQHRSAVLPKLNPDSFAGPLRVPIGAPELGADSDPDGLTGEIGLFTVDGKRRAAQISTSLVEESVLQASAPLRKLKGVALIERSRLDESLLAVSASRQLVADELERLARNIEDVSKKLGAITIATGWLPMGAQDFVRLFPFLYSLGFLLLAARFGRTRQLRQRLEREYQGLGMESDDLELALCSAEASFDPFQFSQAAAALVAAGVVLAFALSLVGLLLCIPSGWLLDSPTAILSNSLAVALGCIGCGMALREVRAGTPR